MSPTSALVLRIPAPLRAALDAEAEACGATVSEVVRRALAMHLGLGTEGTEMPPRPPGPGRGRTGAAEQGGGAP